MSIREWRELNIEELILAIGQAELDLLAKQEEILNGKEKDHSLLIVMRKDVARMNTVRTEKENEVKAAVEAKKLDLSD